MDLPSIAAQAASSPGLLLDAVDGQLVLDEVQYAPESHGTEEHNGRVRLIDVKWTEVPDERRMLAPAAKVRAWLRPRAADEAWLIRRTPHEYEISAPLPARVINGYDNDRWLDAL